MNTTDEACQCPSRTATAPHDAALHIESSKLARLSPLDYAQVKKERAAELGLTQ